MWVMCFLEEFEAQKDGSCVYLVVSGKRRERGRQRRENLNVKRNLTMQLSKERIERVLTETRQIGEYAIELDQNTIESSYF